MTIDTITPNSGTKPDKDTQTAENFDTNMQDFVDWLDGFQDEMNTSIGQMNTTATNVSMSETNAGNSATTAEDWATTAEDWAIKTTGPVDGSNYSAKYHAETAENSAQSALSAPGTSANSTTSIEIGTGLKTFTIETGKVFVPGMTLKAYSYGNWIIGYINSYDSGTGELVLNASTVFGSGTYSEWTISISAPIPDVPGGYSLFSYNNYT